MGVRSLFSAGAESSLLTVENKYFVIDAVSRIITPPEGFKTFGVESDENSNRVWFKCPRIVGDNIDLTTLNLFVNYQNAEKQKDKYVVEDVTAEGDYIYFSWKQSRKVLKGSGTVMFIVCATKTDTEGVIDVEWNTTLCTGGVLAGMEVNAPEIPEDVTDLVSQLVEIVKQAKTDVEAAETQAIAHIETAKSEAVEYINSLPNSIFANAIKGSASGEIVRVNDVSPVEHSASVKVSGKNLFNGVFEKGHYYETELTLTNTSSEIYRSFQIYLKKGTYTLSTSVKTMLLRLYVNGVMTLPSVYGTTYTFVVDSDGIVAFSLREAASANWSDDITVQLEKGGSATEYTPYIDPTTVILTRCGKNLIPYTYNQISKSENGIDFIDNGNGIVIINGTATSNADLALIKHQANYTLPKAKYFISGGAENAELRVFANIGSETVKSVVDKGNGALFDLTDLDYDYIGCYVRVPQGNTLNNIILKPQIEQSGIFTEYETYKGCTYVPDSDGTVNVVTVEPTMTLFTDTEGITIECEYTRDTNVLLSELIKRIATLEGEV